MSFFTELHEHQLSKVPAQERNALIGQLLLYVFRGTTQDVIRDFIEDRSIEFDFLGWRLHLHRNGELLRNGKVFLYRRFCGKEEKPAAYGLTKMDAAWSAKAVNVWNPLQARLEILRDKEARAPIGLRKLDEYVGAVLTSEDYRTYVSKYIHRKMGFLLRSYNTTKDEIRTDLDSWAYYALLKAYPRFDDVGHGIAIAKTTAKNRGVNLMKSMTAENRNALITADSGNCSAANVSLSSIEDLTGQFLTVDGAYFHRSLLVVDLSGKNRSESALSWEDSTSLQELMGSPMLTGKQRLFLRLASGSPDDAFSEWLGESNEDYADRVEFSLLKSRICKYMGLTDVTADRFLRNLRKHL